MPQLTLFFSCISCSEFTTWDLRLNWETFLSSSHVSVTHFSVGEKVIDLHAVPLREWHFGQPALPCPSSTSELSHLVCSSSAELGMAFTDGTSSKGFQLNTWLLGKVYPSTPHVCQLYTCSQEISELSLQLLLLKCGHQSSSPNQ